MSIDCAAFYRERDDRSVEYMGPIDWAGLPVGIAIDEVTASSRPGQVALLALINMAARLHRHILVAVPDVSLLARTLVPAEDLRHAAFRNGTCDRPVRQDRLRGPSVDEDDRWESARSAAVPARPTSALLPDILEQVTEHPS